MRPTVSLPALSDVKTSAQTLHAIMGLPSHPCSYSCASSPDLSQPSAGPLSSLIPSSIPRPLPSPPLGFKGYDEPMNNDDDISNNNNDNNDDNNNNDNDNDSSSSSSSSSSSKLRTPLPLAGTKRRRSSCADGDEDGNDGDERQSQSRSRDPRADQDAPRKRSHPSAHGLPRTPRPAAVGPPEIPRGLHRSDFLDEGRQQPAEGTLRRGRWSPRDDGMLIDWFINTAAISDDQWSECAARLGYDSPDGLSRRWRDLVNKRRVGVSRSTDRTPTSRARRTWSRA
ncbi:hypothetical protein GMORB2_6901 [Geosmithia morbida]|uniref:Myb-like domain-containing protein n=1 Tax=Geosmithia morbida TaxID=1094350 RepID=A0A9P4YX10_9HYPO|nr:uncharacterized protein GMORB2_6901 [Geosmithia morbida]KAF4122594.1 hypothetical protein GMORB2_6901 [Geosmithia morbida]